MTLGQKQFDMWHLEYFWWKFNFYWDIDLNYPLRLLNLDVFRVWHVAQSKVVMWHIDQILQKKKKKVITYIGK
jgi:hypothetical protein